MKMASCQWWERLRLRVSEGAVDRLDATCRNAYWELLAPRTVIASASGWFEAFANEPTQTGHTIACGLVDSTFGECTDYNLGSTFIDGSGLPTPAAFRVSLTVPPTVTPTSSSMSGMIN